MTPVQRERLALLLRTLPANRFYARRLAEAGLDPLTLRLPDDWQRVPFTSKDELVADQAAAPPFGTNLAEPVERYCRYHQTSGTSGRPLRWLDTAESWSWLLTCWETIYDVVGVRPGDRLFFPFSFGPFLGFWTAFDAAERRGCLCLAAGGMSSTARLRYLLDTQANVVLCTPTYALHLAETAREEGIDLARSAVEKLIVAGEPGGSIPATRQRIESAWGARLFDHSGLTEVGPVSIECPENPAGLHVIETHYLAEIIDPTTGQPVPAGTPGELVLTNLGRFGSPLLRYRTGDLVQADTHPCPCGRSWLRLDGGIRGRVDDMFTIRGNNVYPSALQTILHGFAEVAEYRVEVDRSAALPALRVEVELRAGDAEEVVARVGQILHDALLFRAEVRAVPPGTLPRFEMKARRVVRKNSPDSAGDENR
jgi:phenylacetate-CoA ligase